MCKITFACIRNSILFIVVFLRVYPACRVAASLWLVWRQQGMVWTQQSRWHLPPPILSASPKVACHYTGTISAAAHLTVTPPHRPCLTTLFNPQTSTRREKRWMKVTPRHPRRPHTLTMSWRVVWAVLWLVCVTHTSVRAAAAPSGRPYKALSIQRSPLSPADKCCWRASGQGRVAGWEDSEVCLGMPSSDRSAWVLIAVCASGVALSLPSPPHVLIGPYCSLLRTQ